MRYSARHLLGVVLDELGQYEEAFRWLGEAKAIVRTITDTKALERGYDGATRLRREAMESLTPAILRRWRDEGPASDEGYRFAFLGGHPRSGTTLIEQILDAHPRITGFDEPVAFLQEVTRRLPGAAGLAALDGLSTAARATMRNRYTASLLREVAPPGSGSLLLDKNPSPTASLDVWLRLFPEMKVVVALRDPRDVVISCYFLNIMLNATNVNFLSLERTVKHYTDLMGSWLRMKEIGGFDWIETRYEDVVGSLDTEGRKVTSFLGLDWHPDQGRYHETARRKVLYAPTYHDVTQPVYRRAVGRWSRYAEALEPFRETLAPFCRAFGYCW